MNAIHLSGRLATEPEVKDFENSTVCRFKIAVPGSAERTDFFAVEYWNPGGVADLLEKGAPILVSGFLKQEQWTGDKGEKRSRVVVVARVLELLESRAAAEARRAEGRSGSQRKRTFARASSAPVRR